MNDIGAVILLAAAFLTLLLGILVLTQGARNRLAARFFLFITSCSAWIMSNALFVLVDPEYRLAVGLFSYGAAAFLALFFYLFCRALTEQDPSSKFERIIIVIGTANALLSMIPGVIATDVTLQLAIVTNQAALLAYGVILLGLFGAGLGVLTRSYLKSKNARRKKQVAVLIIGLVVGIVFGVGCNLILPLIGNYSFVVFGPLGSLALVSASTYAIVKHQLFDVRLAAMRGAAYVLLLATLAGVYYILAYIASQFFVGQNGRQVIVLSPMSIVLALVLAFLFQPVKTVFDRLTNRIFFRGTYSTEDFYAHLNQILAETNDLHTLLGQVSQEISSTFKASQAFFVVTYRDTQHITVGTKRHARLPVDDVNRFDQYVLDHGDTILTTELLPEHSAKRRILISHDISLLMPLVKDGMILGYLALGEHMGKGYTHHDIKILGTVADELVIAIQNALSIQQIKDINAGLEQRISMATAKLRTSNAQLRRVDAAKDEFLSMASHQLRTPLTSIKGYLSMVLEGDVGKVSTAQRQVLKEAFVSSERMVHLIHDFLNVSRLQTGKFVLEKANYDLAKLVQEEVDELRSVAEARGITISYQAAHRDTLMNIDSTKLRQVLINYMDNALYYSPSGANVEVKLKRLPGKVELTVTDEGIGVPKIEQVHLFEKFYRASNARKHRPDGTGVGLYLAKKIVTSHGGDVLFFSREGKGSTFGFWLPLEHNADQLNKKPNDH